MNEKEIRECYIRLAFQYESTIDALLSKGLIDMEAAVAAKERLNFLRFQEQSNEHFIFTVLFKRKIPRSGKTEIGVFQILF